MRNIIIIGMLIVFMIFSCADPLETLTEKTIIKDGTIEFCNYEVVNTWCWDDNDGEWFDLDLSGHTGGQAIVEIMLIFIDSDDPNIDSASISLRRDEFSQASSISSNHIIGSVMMKTDENHLPIMRFHFPPF